MSVTDSRDAPFADWRLLRVYLYYRAFLAVLLLGLFTFARSSQIGSDSPSLFIAINIGYLLLSIAGLLATRQPEHNVQRGALLQLLTDVAALGLMLHATGDLTSQFSMLLVVTVAAGNILLSGRLGALVAAVATITVLYEQFYFALSVRGELTSDSLVQASVLGLSFFATALFSQLISHRMRNSEALAEQQALDIVGLQALNEQIIQRMRTGIIVVDRKARILLMNEAARLLLSLDKPQGMLLKAVSAPLYAGLLAWHQNASLRPAPFRNADAGVTISASFAELGADNNANILIFLEDAAQMTQQAQQLKLVSLGRMAASIAHEVRNPLGAISHATQLLAESPDIAGPDRRLLDIIEQHCRRMNGVIENVLQLSRRQGSAPERLLLKDWLGNFVDDLNKARNSPASVRITCPDDLLIRFDTRHLDQVLTNLVTNGLRYSLQHSSHETLHLNAGRLALDGLPYLDIIDDGPGISPELREHLFEPFYTTENAGTGLGLYLSRELCESNQARLDCLNRPAPGACFRITFAHPNRVS